ncbi:MAG: tyrosine-type recombinase/integrase [Limosilactobacillus sp.]|uniref:tyrosine-type recombinase/integrase n=1 Tax=Limosilactobacillus sp. TaxID=2773925 RepID=UPI0026FD5E11|nr:tyrosine-type recombinase/integrase [Limosilactobacillus sp.]
MKEVMDGYLTYLTAEQNRSANTVDSYRRDLTQALDYLESNGVVDWANVDQYMLLNLVANMRSHGRSASTINRMLSALRQFFRYLVRHHHVTFNPMEMVDNVQTESTSEPLVLSEDEIKLLLSMDLDGTLAARNKALLLLMAATGMRVSEVIKLRTSDLHLDVKMIRLGADSKRERLIPISQDAVDALDGYVNGLRDQIVVDDEDAVFVNAHGHQMTRQGVWMILKEIFDASGIDKTVTPQTLRYSFAVHLLRSGADTRLIKEMLGYSDMRALQPYLKMSVQEISSDYENHQPW